MSSCNSSLSSLDNRYTFPFLNINSSFMFIAWSHIFLISILSLAFLPKIWIYLWNLEGTNFLASSSDFAAFFSLFQISHFSIILFTFIVFLFLWFFFVFSFSSCLLPFFPLSSSSFYFCYPNVSCFSFYCFPYFSGYLVIFIPVNVRIVVCKPQYS